ncbi:MAG: IPT/TIG domain-containing protein [Chryseolinea sp.]
MRKNIIRPIKRSLFGSMVLLIAITLFVLQACDTSEDPTIGTPTVDSFTNYTDQGTPNAGPVGTLVKLTGTYFSAAGKNTVKFNGVEAKVISSKTSTSNLTVVVPAGATTGPVSVTVGGHTGTSTTNFTVSAGTPAPAILDFSPNTGNGVDGIEVAITGVNFSSTPANNVVEINGVATAVNSVDVTDPLANVIKVNVPSGATTGKITVEVNGANGIATTDKDFSVPTPKIASFTPSKSIVGSTVVITGTNFSKTADDNIVMFNGVAATVVEVNVKDAAANTLTVIVPNTTTGKITVDVDGVVGTSGDPFTVN